MKVPFEILIVVVLVYLGWSQPFKEQIARVTGHAPPLPRVLQNPVAIASPSPVPTPAPDFSRAARTNLDQPTSRSRRR